MATQTDTLSVYRELAERYEKLGQFSMRDRFLMLAASAALESGQENEAERLRTQLLQQNRHHMLRPYRSFREAIAAPDVHTYLEDLKRNYPYEVAHQLLIALQEGRTPPVMSKPLTVRRPAVSATQTSIPPAAVPGRTPLPAQQPPASTPTTSRPEPASLPPTAPVVDPYEPIDATPRPSWQPIKPTKVVDELELTRPVSNLREESPSALPAKPLAQPVPKAAPATPDPARPTVRPAVAVPRPKPSPPAEVPVVPPVAETVPAPETPLTGAWVGGLLSLIVLLAGLALAGYTFARPFLPPGWLP